MGEKKDGKWIENLGPTMPLPEAARHVLMVRLMVVANWLPKALAESDRDPENIHQFRVGTRRAGAALRIFRQCLPGKVFKRARDRLRLLRRAAGMARDWDVFLEELKDLEPHRPVEERPGIDFLMGYALGQRTVVQGEVEATGRHEGRDFDHFVAETVAAVPATKTQEEDAVLLDLARPLLSGLLENLEKALAGDLHDFPHLHQVRIAGKRLRYAMEVFGDCYGPAFKENLYPLVEEMQEILGNINDSYIAGDRLDELRERLQDGPRVDWSRIGPGIDGLLQWHKERLGSQKERFGKWLELWRQSGAEPLLEVLTK